eukprot:Lithocolla_globosa_v1_NODE_1085_length_2885_cov_18.564311.p2 type:complete len:126 gc:universal NODE_1085_length_2885_cov_18.564311:2727-2350(-)
MSSTSGKVLTKYGVTPFLISLSRSIQSDLFASGMIILLILLLFAAIVFSFIPPIFNTFPVSVSSPVMARSGRDGLFIASDKRAVVMVTPAEGPSFEVAPSGTCRCKVCDLKKVLSGCISLKYPLA